MDTYGKETDSTQRNVCLWERLLVLVPNAHNGGCPDSREIGVLRRWDRGCFKLSLTGSLALPEVYPPWKIYIPHQTVAKRWSKSRQREEPWYYHSRVFGSYSKDHGAASAIGNTPYTHKVRNYTTSRFSMINFHTQSTSEALSP